MSAKATGSPATTAYDDNEGERGAASVAGSTVKLKRELGLFSAINLILGVMIGSGIFISPAAALLYSGSVGLCLVIWTLSGIISLLGALSFAELGTVVGKSGAEYSYFEEAFGKMHRFWGPLPSFSCAWIYVMVLRPAEVAVIVMTFAEYAIQPFTPDLHPDYKDNAIKLTSLAALFSHCVFKISRYLAYVPLPVDNTREKMSHDRNIETLDALKTEIKALQESCVNTCHVIENSPPEYPSGQIVNGEEVKQNINTYVKGLEAAVNNSSTLITTDSNLLTTQFLNQIKQKTVQIDELAAYTAGAIGDLDAEISRVKNLISVAQEAQSKPRLQRNVVQPEHYMKAKERFRMMKKEVHGLIQSLLPHNHEDVRSVLGDLMSVKLNNTSEDYIPISPENFDVVQILKDMNIVTINPYNQFEVKLNFIMTYINITSVKLFVKVQNVFGVCKVLACLIVIGGGIYELYKGNTANLNKGFEGSTRNPGNVALALYSGLWAYDGWNSVTVVTEEIINPATNVPLSISIAVPLITALYVFMNVAYMTVLSYEEMVSVRAVAVAFGARVLGAGSFLVPLGVAIATFGCAMSVQFGVTRVCYTAARGGHMLELFSYVNMKRLTPAPAVAFQALLTAGFISVGNIKTLIEFASWFLWFFYGLAMVALLVLRRSQPHKHRPYRVPTPVPCFVLLVAGFLSVVPIVHDPSLKYLAAIGFLLLGVLVYTVFVYYKKTPTALLGKLTFLTQVLFQSVPPSNHQD